MESYEMESWQRFNLGLRIAVQNVREYPRSTDILFELDNILASFTKPGMIEREVQQQVQAEIHACRKAARKRDA